MERVNAQRDRDPVAVRVALGAYLVARVIETYLSSPRMFGIDADVQAQLDAVRAQVSALPASNAEVGHLLGVLDAVPADGDPTGPLHVSLTAYAYFLEHDGRYAESLTIVGVAMRALGTELGAAEFAASALFAARLNRLLSRWTEATGCYAAAEAAAASVGEHVFRLRGRLGQGAVCRGQGNLPKARAFGEEVLQEAKDLGLPEVQLIAYSDLSAVYGMLGLKVEALQSDYQAFLLAPNVKERMRALTNIGIGFVEIGANDSARLAFDIVLASDAEFWIRANASLELMDLDSLVNNRAGFERLRRWGEAERDRMPPSMTADYLHKVGIGFSRFGRFDEARQVLAGALAFAEAKHLNTWYFTIEKSLLGLEVQEREKTAPSVQSTPAVWEAPAILEMEAGLRQFAALQPA